MRKLRENSGFTLIEIIITVAIISVMLGLSGFGISVIFRANVESLADNYYNELRDMKFKASSNTDSNYHLEMTYNSATKEYGYIVDQDNITIKNVTLSKNIAIYKMTEGSTTWAAIETLPEKERFIRFSKGGGFVMQEDYVSVSGALRVISGQGQYKFVKLGSDKEPIVTIIKQTGKVFMNE